MHALSHIIQQPPSGTGSIDPGLPGRVQETGDDTPVRHLRLLLRAFFEAVAELTTAYHRLQTVQALTGTTIVCNTWDVGINVTGDA